MTTTELTPKNAEGRPAAMKSPTQERPAVSMPDPEPGLKQTPEDVVRAAYQGLLGREPDRSGMQNYASRIRSNADVVRLLKALVASAEFRHRHSANHAPSAVGQTAQVASEDGESGPRLHNPGDITFIQTCDPVNYFEMLVETNRTIRAYCLRHGYRQETYVGIKRGFHPWQAAFNRIQMLKDLIALKRRGWIVYIDADAYVADLAFDLVSYLEDKKDVAAIFALSGVTANWWDVNDGIFLINLGHPAARLMVQEWANVLASYSDSVLKASPAFEVGMPGDQAMLHGVLKLRPQLQDAIRLEPRTFINSPGASFLRQVLRSHAATPELRMARIRSEVADVMQAA